MRILTVVLMVCFTISLNSQTTVLEGYIYETGNRGYIYGVSVTAENIETEKIVDKAKTDADGFFQVNVPINSKIRIYAAKDMFDIKRVETEVGTGKAFIKLEMGRAPGYTFEVTLAEKRTDPNTIVDAITGTRIEVFNNTTRTSVMDLKDHDNPEFQLNLQKGNHYTLLIRKNGFLSKRMEAKVDVEGCILCFEGVGKVGPGVTDNLTEGNSFGVLLANVELERIFEGKKMEVQNLYYDLGKWALKDPARAQLNKVITLMKDNPSLTLELGSHTDSRGNSESNQELSKKRAKSAVDYLAQKGDIANNRLISRGYGESIILNKCIDGAKCTEEEHAINRRTELKIVGITDMKEVKSLAQMKKEEYMEQEILGLMDQEQVVAKDEEELKRILEADKKVAGDVKSQIEEIEKIEEIEEIEEIGVEKVIEDKEIETEIVTKEIEELEVETPSIETTTPTNASAKDGIKVVIYQSKTPLPKDHFIFTKHNNVETMDGHMGKTYYMLGGFENESAAFKFMNSFIRPDKKYTGSFVASIKNGSLAVVNQ